MKRRDVSSWPLTSRFSLTRRLLGAGSWALVGAAINYPIRLAGTLLLTRLLAPEMFGVMAIATLVMTALTMFSDFGLIQNIVQSRRGGDSAYLNTTWTIQIIRGLVLWLLALCISQLFVFANHAGLSPKNSVYADPYLPYAIAGVSFSMAIGGFQSTKALEASRYLSLGRITQMRIAAQVIGLICMIGWAFLIDRSIWALVSGVICSAVITTLLSHIWLPGVANRFQWDRSATHEIFHFGKWMFLSSILGFFANNADRVLLGGFVDSAVLGIFSIATLFTGAIAQILETIISQVVYPALSEVARERPHELKHSLYRIHFLTASFTYFCSGLLIVSGDTLIRLLLDPRYAQAGWMLEILAVGLLNIPFNLPMWCLLARGLAKSFSALVALQAAATVALIPLGFYFFGVPGALWGVVASQILKVPAIIYFQIKYKLFDPSKELILLPAFLVGMVLAMGLNLVVGH